MMKKCICLLICLCMLFAAGCGSAFSAEYYFSEPYRESVSIGDGSETEVRNANTLKNAIMRLVYEGESHGQFRFGSYTGSLIDDIAAVCLEIKTATPIGAYAVENISYDTSRIVSYYTADITIEYKKTAEEIAAVKNVNGLGELGEHIRSVMESYGAETVVKIYSSAANEEYIRSFVADTYYSDPFLMAVEPEVTVTAYPEAGPDRIYVIDFRYAAMPERLREMDSLVDMRAGELAESLGQDDELSLAMRCAMQLAAMVESAESESQWAGTAYGCLVEGSSDPFGLAMGYKAICDRLGIECVVVRGERNADGVVSHAWNIINIDGSYYHADVSRFAAEPAKAFLQSDEDFWGEYDWDRDAYPECGGELEPEDVFGQPEAPKKEPNTEEDVNDNPVESPNVSEPPEIPQETPPAEPEASAPVE